MLVFDEVKTKESLVFDKHETEVVGFVDMGDINNKLADLEKECSTNHQHPTIATHMLVLMVRGVFTGLRFSYAHFPVTNSKAEVLFEIVWEAIERIEHKKLKVIVVTADGASSNRKMFCHASRTILCTRRPTGTVRRGGHCFLCLMFLIY